MTRLDTLWAWLTGLQTFEKAVVVAATFLVIWLSLGLIRELIQLLARSFQQRPVLTTVVLAVVVSVIAGGW